MRQGLISAAAVAAALSSSAAAAAPPAANALPATGAVMNRISAADVAGMMSEIGVATESKPGDPGESPFLLATTPGGARFLFRFANCEDVAAAARCANTIVTAAIPSAGATYDDLNDFNGASVVTTAINIEAHQIIVFTRNILVLGGHARDLYKGTVFLFLSDVQAYAERASGPATSVSFEWTGLKSDPKIAMAIGAPAPGKVPGVRNLAPDVEAAIFNTRDVDFSIGDAPGF